MKKWFVFALITCVAVGAQAGEDGKKKGDSKGEGKSLTKEEFVAQQKKWAEKKGNEFNQIKVEAKFDRLDTDKDGLLSPDEKAKGKGKGKGKAKEEGKPAAE